MTYLEALAECRDKARIIRRTSDPDFWWIVCGKNLHCSAMFDPHVAENEVLGSKFCQLVDKVFHPRDDGIDAEFRFYRPNVDDQLADDWEVCEIRSIGG
jgi:hypothetical protein